MKTEELLEMAKDWHGNRNDLVDQLARRLRIAVEVNRIYEQALHDIDENSQSCDCWDLARGGIAKARLATEKIESGREG